MKYLKKILSTTEFVLWCWNNYEQIEKWSDIDIFYSYAKLMTTPLSLGQFVPCKDGKVLEEPSSDMNMGAINDREQYQQACKEIWFEGWELDASFEQRHLKKKETKQIIDAIDNRINNKETIEDLIREVDLIGTDAFWNLVFKL